MKQYTVTGMNCAGCAARVEKTVSDIRGVSSCSVNLLTKSMGVEGTASPEVIIRAVREAGFDAALNADNTYNSESEDEIPALRTRLFTSLGFWILLMYISMGPMIWNGALPEFLEENHMATGIIQLLLTVIIMIINKRFFVSGFKSLCHRVPNMDTLVAMGASAAFVYSLFALFAETEVQHGSHELYFESAATILTLITLGKLLEAHSKGKTTGALEGLMKLAPKTAALLKNGEEITVPVEQVAEGDVFVVRPGESIPVDGIVLEGISAVDESSLTGESIPADKVAGSTVSSGTINQSGFIKCEATAVGADTTLSRIIRMVGDAAATKAPIAKVADRVSGVFVPIVIGISALTIIIWFLAGQTAGFALARGISVLVISCPCALGLATPVAIMAGSGVSAKNGILFKTAVSLEEVGRTQIVALDKTGTITQGEPRVTNIIPAEGTSKSELLSIAYNLEKKSEHPLALAICARAEEDGLEAADVKEFRALPGNGLTATLNGSVLTGGSENFISRNAKVSENMKEKAAELSKEGKTPLLFAADGVLCGIIAVADTIKEDSPRAVSELQNMGIRVVMLTGDNERTAKAIGDKAGVDEVIAGVLPDEKETAVADLQKKGKVTMVGDGINDAPALTRADIGIAIGAGADIAIDAADVVLMKSRLSDVPAAIRLSRATLRNIHQNLFWAFIYNVIGIPLAAGAFIALLGWQLNPMFAAAAMSLSSVCVVTNALRLNLFKWKKGN
ncbi:MAG: heavy metal translocating P-type ATPase [Firmicutes bacterium]|nr:heavy metal translocating P-type ATPase [Bacillota bacterium]